MEHAWQDFGQKVDLTARLREILINYPEGTSILKELVQNADDAKATTVKFCLDYNQYAAESVLGPEMAQFQGPALLAYNDGVFTEKDFESISRIGDSKKREQIGKTGRFGVGFNAIYHLTDVPSFVSGDNLVIFDPHCKHLPAISAANPGKKINFVTHDLNSTLTDQAAPYHLFGCNLQQHFAGTLFRFPLRTQEQANKSTISKQVYTTDSITALFTDLKHEATLVLLFLKCIQSIELLQLLPGHKEPELLFSCSVANSSPGLLLQRSLFLHAGVAPADETVAGTYKLELSSRDTTTQTEHSTSFLVSQRRGHSQLLTMATELSKQFQVPLVAWGAVAAEITAVNTGLTEPAATAGRAFCFLPLPASTHLPVHINGYFELSSNRRDVWHGSDMAGAGRLRAQWNEALLQLVVAPAYLDLLGAAAKMLGPGDAFNRLWPAHDAPDPWQRVVQQLYGHLPNRPLLWSAAAGGSWLTSDHCIFPDEDCLLQQPASAGSAAAGDADVCDTTASGTAVSPDDCSSTGDGAVNPADLAAPHKSTHLGPLGEALLLLGLPLVDLPPDVLKMMQKYLPVMPKLCTPAAARTAAAAHPQHTDSLQRQTQLVPLLSYCMADVDVAVGKSACQQLLGLRLLPLQDGSLATFELHAAKAAQEQQQQQQLVFVVTEELELLLVGSHKAVLLDHNLLGPVITSKLSLMASYSTFNLQHLTVQHLQQSFLPRLQPADWQGKPVVSWNAAAGSSDNEPEAAPTWELLQALWQWLAGHRADFQQLLSSKWPLLPVLGSKLVPLQPLTASAVVAPDTDNWPEGLAEALQRLGVHILDTASFELPVDVLLQHCVHKPTGPGVAAAICGALGWQQRPVAARRRSGSATAAGAGVRLTLDEARLLRGYLLQPHWFSSQTAEESKEQLLMAAKKLPLYELANGNSAQLHEQQQQQQQQSGLATGEGVTVSIKPGCCLAPAGVYLPALDSSFLLSSNDQEAAVMVSRLGVRQPSAAEVYKEVLLPQLEKLPAHIREAAILRMLETLPQLGKSFRRHLRLTPFLPNAAGKLHLPQELYDPRVPELVALLDPDTCFPAPAFCSELLPDTSTAAAAGDRTSDSIMGLDAGFSGLSALQQLGLRRDLDLGTLIVAAKFVEKSAREGDEDMAVARGKALLSYLDTEAERLVGRHTAITSAAAAAMAAADPVSSTDGSQQDQKRPGQGLFSAMRNLWSSSLSGRSQQQQQQQQQEEEARSRLSSHPADLYIPHGGIEPQQQVAMSELLTVPQKAYASQWAELAHICWCPILVKPPEPALPWKASPAASTSTSTQSVQMSRGLVDSCAADGSAVVHAEKSVTAAGGGKVQRLAAPCAARPRKDRWLVSAVMNLVDGNCRSPVVLAGLGWNAQLPGAVLASQLSALGAANRHISDAALAQKLARVVPVLYGALAALPAAELAAAAAVLEGQPTVWVGNGFVPAERVAFKGGLDLSPHLYVLPLELSPFRELIAALGAQEAFSAKQYTTLLQDLARESSGNPLPPHQLSQALAVAQALADIIGASGGGATAGSHAVQGAAGAGNQQQGPVLVPDDEGVLRPAAELAYDDAPWLDAPAAGSDAELHLVHPRLSAPVAEALGVASRRRLMLAASADCLALGLAGSGGAVEAFGQSEALTTRLRHIIQDYPEGPGVLLELVQNADDAGAHKAAFLLDARQYGTSSVLGPGMAAWQGPALLAYNDATFSPGDIAAIARIGQDGKMAQPAAIGRFGLGFNAVYHLTDLPSFVSGQHLVLFDPHAKYLPGASAAQPGLRVNLNRGLLLKQFPDSFAPYMHFGCNMEGSYTGTLFRFPLRSSTAAATSDIKSTPTSAAQALQLLLSLAEVLPQALLFLKSLRQIEVFVAGDVGVDTAQDQTGQGLPDVAAASSASGDFGAPRLLFRVSLESLDGSGPLQQPITHFVSSGGGGSGAQQLDAFYRRLEATQESKLPSSVGRVQLTMSISNALSFRDAGAEEGGDARDEHTSTTNALSFRDSGAEEGDDAQDDQLQLVGTSSENDGLEEQQQQRLQEVVREEWLVCNHLGGGSARALALQAWKDEKVKMIPWVGVAARLSTDEAAISRTSQRASKPSSLSCGAATAGRAFCFLPLPASTHLPVHINGYFELSSNRRDVWHGSDMAGAGRLRAQWNEALLESAVAAAYLQLLLEAAQLLGPSQQYWQLFPQGVATVPEPWIKVAAAVYQKMAGHPVCWSPVAQGSWLTPQQVMLPDVACYQRSIPAATQAPAAADPDDAVHIIELDPSMADRPASSIGYVDVAAGASWLSELLVSCGVALVMAFSEEQQKCLLQWTTGTQQISPALTRKLLASNPQQLAATVARRQPQQHAAGQQQPAAAVLLEYCMSDVNQISSAATSGSGDYSQMLQPHVAELLIALQQLHGLPLLPVLDGSVKALEAARGQSSRFVATAPAKSTAAGEVVYVCSTQLEHQLLQVLPQQILHPAVGPVLQQQLLQVAATRATNIAQLTVRSLDQHIMAQLLPPAWKGQQQVDWAPDVPYATAIEGSAGQAAQQQQQQVWNQPNRDFIKLLWHWLADRPDVADLTQWPVLAVAGCKLRLLQQPAQVLRGGDWTESLTSALLKLGCCLLDCQILDFPCPALAPFVQQPTAAGVLDAVTAAAVSAAASTAGSDRRLQGGSSSSSRPQGSMSAERSGAWQQLVQELTAAERNQLRAYLLQAKWFAGDASLTKQQLNMLYSLPIYEVHAPLQFELPKTSSQQQQQQQTTAAAAPHHVSLIQLGPQLLLPPHGVSSQVLGSRFLRSSSETEDEILVGHLGVERLRMSDFMAAHLIMQRAEPDQRALISTLVYVLEHLRELVKSGDERLPSVMRDLPIIPTCTAIPGQQQQQQHQQPALQHFAAPKELFDPRNPNFRDLLDPRVHFPALPFDGSSGSSSSSGGSSSAAVPDVDTAGPKSAILDGLVLCGLRTELDLEVLVLAAESISQRASNDSPQQHRATALLRHLDQWAQQHPEPTDDEAALWKTLQGLPWCPVVVHPPEEGLPWPHARGKPPAHDADPQQQLEGATAAAAAADAQSDSSASETAVVLRVAPKLVAPADMCWLVSAPLRLLAAAAAAAAPSPELQKLMGWTQQQVLRPSVAIAQLMELGKMYPAGQVYDTGICAKLLAAAGTLYSSLSRSSLGDVEHLQLLSMTLSVVPSVWVGSGFAYPAVAALQASPAAVAAAEVQTDVGNEQQQQAEERITRSAAPAPGPLWVVPSTLQQQHPHALSALRAIGVKQQHDFAAYAIALAALAERAEGQPLQGQELSTALQLAEAAGQSLLSGSGSIRQLQQQGVVAAAAAAAGVGAVTALDGTVMLQLPDSDGVMATPSELYFNDATWLESQGLRLAHAELSQATAEALGIRSMRYQHEVSEQLTNSILCPSVADAAAAAALVLAGCSGSKTSAAAPATHSGTERSTSSDSGDAMAGVASLTGPATSCSGPVLTVLLSILAWADQLRTADGFQQHVGSMSVVFDQQQYGKQSLLHPGLAQMQGPSLCIALYGVTASAAQLSQCIAVKRPGVAPAGTAAAFGGAGHEAKHPAAAAVQLGLTSVWAITDVLQAMSGETTSYWDPSGSALAQSAAEVRNPAPRGRSIKHNQPGLTDRFADQWAVWQAVIRARTDAAASSSTAPGTAADQNDDEACDVLYLRLPLRLQDNMHGSAIGAEARGMLGAGHIGLTTEDVRRQVAAFGPAASKSLLFLGHIHQICVSCCQAGPDKQAGRVGSQAGPDKQAGEIACHPVRIWQATIVPDIRGNMPIRTGVLGEQHAANRLGIPSPGFLARMAAGVRGRGNIWSNDGRYKNCWEMHVKTVCRPGMIAELANSKAAAEGAGVVHAPAAASQGGVAGTAAAAKGSAVARELAVASEVEPQQQQQGGSSSSGGGSFSQAAAAATAPGHVDSKDQIVTEQYTWRISCVCEDAYGIQPPSPPRENVIQFKGVKFAPAQHGWITAAVGVCIKEGDRGLERVVPAGGLFSSVAVTAAAPNMHLAKQNFLISIQGPPGVLLFNPATAKQPEAHTPFKNIGEAMAALEAAAAARTPSQQQRQQRKPGIDGLLEMHAQQMQFHAAQEAAKAAQRALSVVAEAWNQLLLDMVGMGLAPGLGREVYQLAPNLVSAAAAGDCDAVHVFKMMYQSVSSSPVWQLHNGQLVHLQEGAFLSPRTNQQQQQQHGTTQPAVASGLGEDARLFITQHLPLFSVPWFVVAQLEAAGVKGLRLVSPATLRPLLCSLGNGWPHTPKGPQKKGADLDQPAVHAAQSHPYAKLSPVQAVQLLEFCCSDLTASDRSSIDEPATAASSSSSSGVAASSAAGPTMAGPGNAPENAGMPAGIPAGAAAMVSEMFGQQGLAALRGLASQLQTQLVQGVDEVLNAVIDAMNDPRQQQQQAAAVAATAGPTANGSTATTPATAAENEDETSASSPEVNMRKVTYLKGLPIPTAAGTIVLLGKSTLFVYPEACSPVPQSLLPSHLQQQFVSSECVAALSWAFKHADLRQELNLAYYGLQHLARHLQDALGSTWEVTQPAAVPGSSSRGGGGGSTGLQATGLPAAAAVPWDDGAAGGPYLDWLQRLWAVMLHLIADTSSWQQNLSWELNSAADAVDAAGSRSSRVAGGIRSATERARHLGRGIADILAAELTAGGHSNGTAAGGNTQAVAAESAAAAAANFDVFADVVWQPLAEWPLLPLVDGRLLKMKHRKMVLVVRPAEEQQQSGDGGQQHEQEVAGTAAGPAWASNLPEPWNWLLPAAVAAGVPVLDPRFNSIVTPVTAGSAVQTLASSYSLSTSTPAAAAAMRAIDALTIAVRDLLGPQPVVDRPPFLGPLVTKFLTAQQVLGSFRDSQAASPWDESIWSKLFDLLADHPPRDLQPESIRFLRSLPMFRRLQQQQQQTAAESAVEAGSTDAASSHEEGDSSTAEAVRASKLVALGDDGTWVLVPQTKLEKCSGLLSLPSLPNTSTSHILEHRPIWGELYSILGLTPASLADLLSSLLLPNLLQLSKADRLVSLAFIQQHWSAGSQALSQDRSFVAALSQLAFVPAVKSPAAAAAAAAVARAAGGSSEAGEQLYRADQLLDPTVTLFAKVMATMTSPAASSTSRSSAAGSTGVISGELAHAPLVATEMSSAVLFPAPPFDSSGWLQILRALGLLCKVNAGTFMQLAQHIAARAAALASATSPESPPESPPGYLDVSGADPVTVGGLTTAADAMLSYLKSHWTGLGTDKAFWAALGKVPFVPATLGLPGGKYMRQVFTSCSNVAAHKDWPLVWSVVPLLSDGRALPGLLAQQLGLKSPPPLTAVLQHLHAVGVDGGEELLASWPDGSRSVTEATLAVLDHLDREGLSQWQAAFLSGAAFIPVAHFSRFVPPVQLFVRLGGAALAPFAWEVPGVLVGKLQLLKQLGVRDEPRAEDLVQALQHFEVALAGRCMNPNELSACLRLLAYLCSRSSAGDASYLASARRSGTALLVPTAGGLLMPASRVVAVGNAGGGLSAARLLGRADPQHLILAHPQLSDHICRWLGVASLSDVLTEQLDPSLKITPLPAVNNTSLQHLQQLLSSPDFASSVFSIAAAHAAAVPDLRQLSLGAVSRVCAAAAAGKLLLVEKLGSRVVMKSNRRDVTRDSASRQVYEFYDSSSGTMYVATPPPGLPLSSLIAQVLSRALGSPLTLPLHPLLEVKDPQQLMALQPVLLPGGYDMELEAALASGHVGSPVQSADRALLRLRPLRHYTAGELVAVKRRATAAAAGGASGNSGAGTSSSNGESLNDADGGSGHQLCYARVAVDAAPAAGQAAYRLSVEVLPGVYEAVLSTQVFCFQSGAAGSSPPVPVAAPAAEGESDRTGQQPVDEGGVGSSSSSAAVATGGGQQMSASELATAVNDMLTAAGLPLDLDRQALLQRALASDQQLNAATAALAEIRQEVTRKETEVEALKSHWQCRVCFSRDVNQAFTGCGHMYCSECMRSLPKCPVCRKASQKIKLFK